MPPTTPSPRLRVAIDALPLLGQRSGIGHTTAQLLAHAARRDDLDVCAYAIGRRARALLPGLIPPGARHATSILPARAALALWSTASRPRIEHWTGPVDVVHGTNFVAPPARAPVLVTVHDLAFARYPELCRPETRAVDGQLRRALDAGAHVLAVSDTVACEVQEHFGLPQDRVTRVYLGVTTGPSGDPAAGRSLAGGARYVLALGTVEPRKNLAALVDAFTPLADRFPDVALVIAGGDGWGTDDVARAITGSPHSARIRRLGYVTDSARADLLAGAAVLAYPSLYEGFGHPPLEAMAAGVPVVATRAGALPEVLGDAALLADPLDVASISEALERALSDEALRAGLVDRGRIRARRFGWEAALDELVALYRRCAGVDDVRPAPPAPGDPSPRR